MSRSGAYKITSLKFADASKARAQRIDERNDIRKTARQAQSNAKRGIEATPKASKSNVATSSKENQAAVVAEITHDQKLKERLARLKVWREQKVAEEKKAKAKKKQPFLVPTFAPKAEPLAKRDPNTTIRKETKAVVSNPAPRMTRSQAKKGSNGEKQWIVSSQEPRKSATPVMPAAAPVPSFAPENFVFSAPKVIAQISSELLDEPVEIPEPSTSTADTPQRPNNNKSEEDVKISPLLINNPWITTTRGSSSRKEQHRLSLAAAASPDVQSSPLLKRRANSLANAPINPHVLHFRTLMSSEGSRLTDQCSSWDELLNSGDVPEEETGSVRTVIGQTHLLQRERFNQFAELVNQFENKTSEKPITPKDLEGFWEGIIYPQVLDVDKKFEDLGQLRANGWVKVEEEAIGPKKPRTKVGAAKKKPAAGAAAKSNMRAYIMAARKNQLAAATKSPGSPSVRRRSSLLNSPMMTPSKRQSLRRSVLISSAKKPVFVITDLPQKETGSENEMPPPLPALKRLELNEEDEGVPINVEKVQKKTYGRTPRKELDASTGSPKEERLSSAFDALKSEATTSNADSDEEKDQMAPMMKVFRTPTKIVEPIKTVEEEVSEGSQVVHTPRRSIRLRNNQSTNVSTAVPTGRVSLLPVAAVSPVTPQDNLMEFD